MCLRVCRGAVTEQTTFLRPHLEEPEIPAVLRVGTKAGLAASHLECLAAIRAEEAADRRRRCLDPCRRQLAGKPLLVPQLSAMRGEIAFRRSETPPMRGDLPSCLGLESWVAEEPPVIREETEHLTVSLHGAHRRRDALRGCCRRRSEGDRG